MKRPSVISGVLPGGLPFARFGNAERRLVIFPGLADAAWEASNRAWDLPSHYGRLAGQFTVFVISRKRGLPKGYTTLDMAADYARAFDHEIGTAAVLGISLGGSVAQHFAAEFPQLVQRLALACTAHRISEAGRRIPEHWLSLAREQRWREFYFDVAKVTVEQYHHTFYQFLMPLVRMNPVNPSDFLMSLEASLTHDGTAALGRIRVPTLVIGGSEDVFFPPSLLRETARLIPQASLRLINGSGHGAYELQRDAFEDAVLEFLCERESPSASGHCSSMT